jgi:hypothetical protein
MRRLLKQAKGAQSGERAPLYFSIMTKLLSVGKHVSIWVCIKQAKGAQSGERAPLYF